MKTRVWYVYSWSLPWLASEFLLTWALALRFCADPSSLSRSLARQSRRVTDHLHREGPRCALPRCALPRLCDFGITDTGVPRDGTGHPLRLPCLVTSAAICVFRGSAGVAEVHRRKQTQATLTSGCWSRQGPDPQTANAERHHHSAFTCGGVLSPLSHARSRPTRARTKQRRRACRG